MVTFEVIAYILSLAFQVAGAVLLGLFGFNKGMELNGGYEMEVSVDVNFGDNKTKIEKFIVKYLKSLLYIFIS